LRAGPAPLTLVSLGRWASIAGGSRSISSGASMSDLLTTCVECGGKVSTAAQSCRVCGKKPKGVRCVLCNKPMPERDVFKTRVPHEMSYSHEGAHRRYGSISVHKHCWERLVAELFPETSLRGSCPACGLGRNRPESTEVGFPSEWTCQGCGHPCELSIKSIGWCSKCKLPIVPGLHGYWSRMVTGHGLGLYPTSHQCCGKQESSTRDGRSTKWCLREAGDARPPTLPSIWDWLFS
jgi:hypothetical protein